MRSARAVVVFCLALTACAESTPPDEVSLVDEAVLSRDIAASAGFAMALHLVTMVSHEEWASQTHLVDGGRANRGASLTIGRENKCYDASGGLVSCVPFGPVRKIVTTGGMHGTRSSDPAHGSPTWSGAVHRTLNDTTTRIFAGNTETERVHSGVDLGNDTTTLYDGTIRRYLVESFIDSVRAVRFTLPHPARPSPVSGSMVRRVSARVTITKGERNATHEFTRRVEVIFPADAEGRVVLKVDAMTCMLTLSNRVVSGCQ